MLWMIDVQLPNAAVAIILHENSSFIGFTSKAVEQAEYCQFSGRHFVEHLRKVLSLSDSLKKGME